ncbi:replication initiator protein A [Azospirillum brasilense]|nr:replication initiator protein A [Azospirillum brasilense]
MARAAESKTMVVAGAKPRSKSQMAAIPGPDPAERPKRRSAAKPPTLENLGQLDLFEEAVTKLGERPDSPLIGSVKNARTMMVWSFFSLGRERVTELPVYNDGKVWIEVTGTKHGVPTMLDKEVLIYIVSLIQDKMNRGEVTSRVVTFRANDFFMRTGRKPAGTAYDWLEEALIRLKGTLIRTNIQSGDGVSGTDEGFSWIDRYRFRYTKSDTGEKVGDTVVVMLSDWVYGLVTGGNVLTYNPSYFDLKPLERRLYEVARAHCGSQSGFRMNIEKLRLRAGSDAPLKEFKRMLTNMVTSRKFALIDYGFIIRDPRQARQRLGEDTVKRRTPLKAYEVFFYPRDGVMAAMTQDVNDGAPLIEDGDAFLTMSDEL